MKGDEKLIEVLNQLLADELTAISQYMVHSEMCDHWGYDGLHKPIEARAIDEMHHAEWLIGRILFLEGIPIVSKLNPMEIGKTVPEMIANDIKAELGAVKAYNEGIALAEDVGDEGTADLLVKILGDEENHIDWGEKQQAQIAQMGLENYLATQVEDEE
ncbi:MAG: bacterioferritin [Anaerolineaceae bacterium]|nr:MAG: bacterioferritin [Anaerolineaceae bacterium]